MAAVLDIVVQVSKDGTAQIKNVQRAADDAEKSTKKLSTSTKDLNQKYGEIARNAAFAVAGIYGISKAIDISKAAVSSFIDTAAKFETFQTTLTAITGSSLEAEKSMGWIRDFAAKTPFEIDQVTEAFVKMKAYGLNPTDGTLKSLGNTASAMGKDIVQAVEAMADAVTGENERLKEFGIKAKLEGEQVAYTWADSSGKVRNIVIKNNKDIIQSTLNAIFNEKYTGAMDAQSRTWSGTIANMNDAWTNFKVDFMDAGLFAYIKALANTIATYIKAGFTDAENGAKDFSDGVIGYIKSTIIGIGNLYDAWNGISFVLEVIKNGALEAFLAITEAIDFWPQAISDSGVDAQNAFGSAITSMKNLWFEMINYLGKAWNDFWADWVLGFNKISALVGSDIKFNVPTFDPIQPEKWENIQYEQRKASKETEYWTAKLKESDVELKRIYNDVANETGLKRAQKAIADINLELSKQTGANDDLKKQTEEAASALEELIRKNSSLTSPTEKTAKAGKAAAKASKDKLFQMDTEKTLNEFIAGGYSQSDLSKIYDGMWDQYTDKGIEANKEITMDFTSQFEGMLKGIFSGDIGGAIKGFVDGISTELMAPMIKQVSTSLTSGLTSLMGGLGTFGSGLVGLGLGLIGAFSGDTVSQAEIDAAKGQTEFSDESIKNLGAMFEQVQYPMLEATNKMYKHIRNMDANFYQIARAISAQASAGGVDITGGSFTPKASANLYSSKTLTLLSSGLKFDEQMLSEMLDPNTLSVQAYEKVLSQKNYLWKSSSYISTRYKDLPPEVMKSLADVFSEGFYAILEAGTLLGINGLEEQLKNVVVDMGTIDFKDLSDQEVADRLNEAISTMFSDVIGQVDAFTLLLDRYAKGAEDSMETLIRIATEYDQASHYFSLIGKDFNDGIYDFTKTWTETYTIATGDYTDILGRTVDDAFVEMYSSIDGLTSKWLRPTMEEVTLVFTETTKEIYTAQMQMLDIVESAGGMQSFSDAMGVLMSNFYTDAEQLEFMVKSLDIAFETLGIKTMPTTNDEFRRLLETMDTSTEEGAYLYGQILLLAESFNSMTTAAEQLKEETSGMMKEISDAWLSDLSYLTLAQKADYASAYLELSRTSNGMISGVDAARANAEFALKTTATKEDYIPVFNQYIAEIEKQTKDATNLDLLEELRNIKNEVIELREATYNAATYG